MKQTKTLNRIMIFGLPGSGKSTFAVKLGKLLSLPIYHLDRYFFVENWQERNYDEFLTIQQDLVNQQKWIIEGNATRSLEMRYAKADLVLYFKQPKLLCTWRVIKRMFSPDLTLNDMPAGCTKIVRWKLIKYLWGFDQRVYLTLKHLHIKYPNTSFITLEKDEDINVFLDNNLDR